MRTFLIGVVLLMTAPAFAQQQQVSPSQAAIAADNIINGLANAVEQEAATIKADNEKIADLQKQLADLKTKSDAATPAESKLPEKK